MASSYKDITEEGPVTMVLLCTVPESQLPTGIKWYNDLGERVKKGEIAGFLDLKVARLGTSLSSWETFASKEDADRILTERFTQNYEAIVSMQAGANDYEVKFFGPSPPKK